MNKRDKTIEIRKQSETIKRNIKVGRVVAILLIVLNIVFVINQGRIPNATFGWVMGVVGSSLLLMISFVAYGGLLYERRQKNIIDYIEGAKEKKQMKILSREEWGNHSDDLFGTMTYEYRLEDGLVVAGDSKISAEYIEIDTVDRGVITHLNQECGVTKEDIEGILEGCLGGYAVKRGRVIFNGIAYTVEAV